MRWVVVFGVSGVLACQTQAEQKRHAEAERVSLAITQLRNEDNASKAARLEALERVPCGEADICSLKHTCVAAYRSHLRGLRELDRVRRALNSAGAAVPTNSAELADALRAAEANIRGAREAVVRCADFEGDLKRRYKF